MECCNIVEPGFDWPGIATNFLPDRGGSEERAETDTYQTHGNYGHKGMLIAVPSLPPVDQSPWHKCGYHRMGPVTGILALWSVDEGRCNLGFRQGSR